MKKTLLTSVAAAGIMLFFFTGCDKYHRGRYTGTWEFVTVMIFANINSVHEHVEVKRDTVYYLGKISLGNAENILFLQYTENDKIPILITKDRDIYSHASSSFGKWPDGSFEGTNKLSLQLHWGVFCHYEGDTDRRYDIIVGTKKGRR